MTKDETEALLADIGVVPYALIPQGWDAIVAVFEQFAAKVAAREREACISLVECAKYEAHSHDKEGKLIALVLNDAVKDLVTAIRARGEQA